MRAGPGCMSLAPNTKVGSKHWPKPGDVFSVLRKQLLKLIELFNPGRKLHIGCISIASGRDLSLLVAAFLDAAFGLGELEPRRGHTFG